MGNRDIFGKVESLMGNFYQGLNDLIDGVRDDLKEKDQMGSVTVNGRKINIQGKNISVVNGRVLVDGEPVTEDLT